MAETVVWIDSSGLTLPIRVEWNVSGRFAPRAEIVEAEVPGVPGSRVREVRHVTKQFTLPVWITADDEVALRTVTRELVKRMDPLRGPGKIRVTAPGGDQREITCLVSSGLDMVEALGSTSAPTLQRTPLVFRAHDPYWAELAPTNLAFDSGEAVSFFPFFPLRLSSSEIFSDGTADNVGDVDTWPVWTIRGPAEDITLRNVTTGKYLTLNVSLLTGESVVIDTRPGRKSVTHSSGANLFRNLSSLSSMWPLLPGANAVRVEMTGSTPEVSQVLLSWLPLYLSV